MSPKSPTPLLLLLQEQLAAARAYDTEILAHNAEGQTMLVPGIGKNISTAYEQLRKSAESVEEYLLLQRAIRRFYNRTVAFSSPKKPSGVGGELVLELTHAGYLANESVSTGTATTITRLTQEYVEVYKKLGHARVPRDVRLAWVLDLLTVETEALLNPHYKLTAIAYVAFQHYLSSFPREKFVTSDEEDNQYEMCLYVAVHQALLKSDIATVRYNLGRIYRQSSGKLGAFIDFNRSVDRAFSSRLTQKLKQLVNRYGAPFRIVRSLCDDRDDVPELLGNQEVFLQAYDQQMLKEYRSVAMRLKRGIIKSIVFIFITKVSVGLAIEIPYDILVHGSVAILPLAVNLLFPPLYMASFGLGLRPPSRANAEALHIYIDQVLYTGKTPIDHTIRVRTKPMSAFAKLVYTLFLFVPLSMMVYVLMLLHFNVVQGFIFFVFLSTASYLGFRLSRMSRELELLERQTKLSGAVRDFFYLPFIVMGQWISSKYARLNLVAYILDILVELPLKTVLRLVRQWVRFLNEKHEEMY